MPCWSAGQNKGLEAKSTQRPQRLAPKTIDNLFRKAASKRSQSQLGPDSSAADSSCQKLQKPAAALIGATAAADEPSSKGTNSHLAESGARLDGSGALHESSSQPQAPQQQGLLSREGGPAGRSDESSSAADGPGCDVLEDGLEGIDLEEQKRIMHEIWVQQNMKRSVAGIKGSQKDSNSGHAPTKKNQPRLTDMFTAKRQ